MRSTFTRNVGDKMMKELKGKGAFEPFVAVVRENKNDDLALCFRGNDSEIGKVTIYRNNHMIWELSIIDGIPHVMINPDHARFMTDWLQQVKKLMNLGFRDSNNNDFDRLMERKDFVNRHYSSKHGYSYSAKKLYYIPAGSKEEVESVVRDSYEILVEMQEDFFNPKHREIFRIRNPKTGKYEDKEKPRNHIKQYYFENHSDAYDVDNNHNFYANFQPCIEKHVQQELFLKNHFLNNGLFVYDLEFVQPPKPGVNIKNNNKPDMFGIRFDSEGNMQSICMIEVKSTPSALNQNSGLEKHLDGMKEYLDNNSLMNDRKAEAYEILKQYKELRLYGVKKVCNETEFLKLKKEIIFVFSHDVRNLDKKIHRGITIRDVLEDFDSDDVIETGTYTGDITVMCKNYG